VYPSLPASAARISLAQLSVVAFKSLINPALTKAYAPSGGVLVDVTAATDGLHPADEHTQLIPYGTIPVAVRKVCT